jgi:hypothetical protein
MDTPNVLVLRPLIRSDKNNFAAFLRTQVKTVKSKNFPIFSDQDKDQLTNIALIRRNYQWTSQLLVTS